MAPVIWSPRATTWSTVPRASSPGMVTSPMVIAPIEPVTVATELATVSRASAIVPTCRSLTVSSVTFNRSSRSGSTRSVTWPTRPETEASRPWIWSSSPLMVAWRPAMFRAVMSARSPSRCAVSVSMVASAASISSQSPRTAHSPPPSWSSSPSSVAAAVSSWASTLVSCDCSGPRAPVRRPASPAPSPAGPAGLRAADTHLRLDVVDEPVDLGDKRRRRQAAGEGDAEGVEQVRDDAEGQVGDVDAEQLEQGGEVEHLDGVEGEGAVAAGVLGRGEAAEGGVEVAEPQHAAEHADAVGGAGERGERAVAVDERPQGRR